MRPKIMLLSIFTLIFLTACSVAADSKPPMPSKIKVFEEGVPVLDVYVVANERVETMLLEDYLAGVLAGEMRADWPEEALKAQAILARTFVLKFIAEKTSKYPDADISTDIQEAQAYNAAAVDGRIIAAVESTRGQVIAYKGQLPYAWFHAHSGGTTAGAKEGLNWNAQEPGYTRVGEGFEDDTAPMTAAQWQTTFTEEEVLNAAAKVGVKLARLESFTIGNTGASGRAVTLAINGKTVNAADFRIAIGSTSMRSTLLTEVLLEKGMLTLSGKGYGHGVGMSQWGAYALAIEGKKAEEIVHLYFNDVTLMPMY